MGKKNRNRTPAAPPKKTGWLRSLFAGVPWKPTFIAAGIAFALFLPVTGFNFVNVDDPKHIDNNPYYRPLTVANVMTLWTKPYLIYMPVTFTSWALDAMLAGPHTTAVAASEGPSPRFRFQPGIFHFTNLLLHVLCTILVFWILRLWVRHDWAAFAGAVLFAVHPLQVEPVAWVSARKDTLSGFFFFSAIWLYTLYARSDRADKWKLYATAFGAFVLAMLAKPPVAVLPAILVVSGRWIEGKDWKQLAQELGPWFLAALPVVFLAVDTQPDERMPFVPPALAFRPLVALDAVAFYLGKLLYPFDLVMDYGRSPEWLKQSSAVRWTPWVALMVLASAAASLFFPRTRWFGVGMAIFVIALSPVLGLKPFFFQTVSTVSDRYVYAGMLGIAFLLAYALKATWRQTWIRYALVAVGLFLGARSYSQSLVWRDSLALLRHNVAINPASWLAWNNLGSHFEKLTRWDLAAENYEKAAEIHPTPLVYNNLGSAYMNLNQIDRAERAFRQSIALDPNSPIDHFNLGLVYQNRNKIEDARRSFETALRLNPAMEPARAALRSLVGVGK